MFFFLSCVNPCKCSLKLQFLKNPLSPQSVFYIERSVRNFSPLFFFRLQFMCKQKKENFLEQQSVKKLQKSRKRFLLYFSFAFCQIDISKRPIRTERNHVKCKHNSINYGDFHFGWCIRSDGHLGGDQKKKTFPE